MLKHLKNDFFYQITKLYMSQNTFLHVKIDSLNSPSKKTFIKEQCP